MGGMIMEEYKKADASMTYAIIEIMSECFDDPKWFVKFFLDKKLSLENCYVCTLKSKVISLLHVIPLKIRLCGHYFKGAYIYGACTLPNYRNNGYMTKLIKYTHEVCLKDGYECVFLVPAIKDLEKFYGKLGYVNFFKFKQVELTRNEILKLCEKCNLSSSMNKLDSVYSLLGKLRNDIYINENAVIYRSEDLRFADQLYALNLGGLVASDAGYGFCMILNSTELKIIDFTAIEGKECEILRKITDTFPSYDKFLIETSPLNKFFKNFGSNYFNGMILSLSENVRRR